MIEDEARNWIRQRFDVSRETTLDAFLALLIAENEQQNLVSRDSINEMWSRHIVDSAQLLDHTGDACGAWVDIGTGAGFPGLVIGLLSDRQITLVEPRRKRAAFLEHCAQTLGLSHFTVECCRIEKLNVKASVMSARAVASVEALFNAASHCADLNTIWLLPKGPAASEEVEVAQRTWHGTFHVERSVTKPDSLIVVAKGVRRR